MNNRIKFRAWDINEEKYIAWEKIIRTRYNQDWYRLNENKDITLSALTDSGLYFEQWTGLYDANGVEIYEGDIIKTCRLWSALRDPSFYETIEVKYIINNNQAGWNIFCAGPNQMEVIGNVHNAPFNGKPSAT